MKFLTLTLLALLVNNCTESSFKGGARSRSRAKAKEKPKFEDDLSTSSRATMLTKDFRAFKESSFWLYGKNGDFVRAVINPDKSEGEMVDVAQTKKWKINPVGGGGARTFVLEGGALIAGLTGGKLFWINEDTPTDGLLDDKSENYFVLPDWGENRACVVSYKLDDKRYIGVAGQNGKFAQIELESVAPYKPIWSSVQIISGAFGAGGYACYMDQTNNIFYSAWLHDPKLYAFDVKNKQALGERGTHSSYGMSGDNKGNPIDVVKGIEKLWSASFDAKNNKVWITDNTGKITYANADCISENANCVTYAGTQQYATGISGGTSISALKNGGAILNGKDPAKTYYVNWDDKKKKFIMEELFLTGNPSTPNVSGAIYMYTDFTGAALYKGANDLNYDFTETEGYSPRKKALGVIFSWNGIDGLSTWSNLVLKVRCFTSTNSDTEFFEVADVNPSGELTIINNEECQGDVVGAELEIEPLNNSSNVDKLSNVILYLDIDN